MEPMATLHSVKTHSVRIRGVAFRCEPGSRREQILQALQKQDGRGWDLTPLVAGLLSSGFFMLGGVVGWLI